MGDLASMQAVTGVNAEQASKRVMRLLSWLRYRESRSFPERMSEASGETAGVVATACRKEEIERNTGSPAGERDSTGNPRGTGRAGWGGGQARSTDEAG